MGCVTVRSDRSLTLTTGAGGDTAAVAAELAAFAELVRATETLQTYQLTAVSIWRARRQNLSLNAILHTLETYSSTEIPTPVRADIERWSQQIERLTLEADPDRLVLRGLTPQVITAVRDHRILGTFVHHQINATTLALRADTYPELVQTFDAYYHPVLDRVPKGWTPIAPSADSSPPRGRRAARRSSQHAPKERSHRGAPRESVSQEKSPPPAISSRGARPGVFADVLHLLSRQCQATTKAGRQCKNRARPPSPFCRVHGEGTPGQSSRDPHPHQAHVAGQLLDLMLEAGVVTVTQLALLRVGILVGISLGSWLMYTILMGIGEGWFNLSLAAWYMAGLAVLITCGLVGRIVGRIGFLPSLSLLLVLLASLVVDCFHKEGLILNLCFVLIPLALPAAIVYQYGLSLWWGCLLVPVGLVFGTLFHLLLEETSA